MDGELGTQINVLTYKRAEPQKYNLSHFLTPQKLLHIVQSIFTLEASNHN